MRKLLWGLFAAAMLGFASPANGMPSYDRFCFTSDTCGGISVDGTRAVFPLDEGTPEGGPNFPLAPVGPVHQRWNGQTTPIFDPYPADLQLFEVAENADRVIVGSRLALSAEDVDGGTEDGMSGFDTFLVEDGQASLLSADPADPSSFASGQGWTFFRASVDLERVFYSRAEFAMPPCSEYLVRTSDRVIVLPVEDCYEDRMVGISPDGGTVFVDRPYGQSPYALRGPGYADKVELPVPGDQAHYVDSTPDGSSALFSDGTRVNLNANPPAVLAPPVSADGTAVGMSADGQSMIFATSVSLAAADLDPSRDLYLLRPGRAPALVTTGPADTHPSVDNPAPPAMFINTYFNVFQADASNDLGTIAFESDQRLTAEDQDDKVDVYSWVDGTVELVSTGPTSNSAPVRSTLLEVSANGERVAFTTTERMNEFDHDGAFDLYARIIGSGETVAAVSRSVPPPPARTILMSAESNPPEIVPPTKGRLSGKRIVKMRLACPASEETGPCRGTVKLSRTRRSPKGTGWFAVAPGKTRTLNVRLKRPARFKRWKTKLTVRAEDALGNAVTRKARIRIR